MKIEINSAEKHLVIPVPDCLLSPKLILWLVRRIAGKNVKGERNRIHPEVLEAIFRELRVVKNKHETWELADIQLSKGERIYIIL